MTSLRSLCVFVIAALAWCAPRATCADEKPPRFFIPDSTLVVWNGIESMARGERTLYSDEPQCFVFPGVDQQTPPADEKDMRELRYKTPQQVVILYALALLRDFELADKQWTWGRFIAAQGNGAHWERRTVDERELLVCEGALAVKSHHTLAQGATDEARFRITWDPEKETVISLDYEITAHCAPLSYVQPSTGKRFSGDSAVLTVTGAGAITLLDHKQPIPQAAIDCALIRGESYLRRELARYADCDFEALETKIYLKSYNDNLRGPGRFAAVLYALCVKHPDLLADKELTAAFDNLLDHHAQWDKKDVYTWALTMMAIQEYVRACVKTQTLADEHRQRAVALAALGAKLAGELVATFRRDGWGYPGESPNFSTTQFAILGLYAAVNTGYVDARDKRLQAVVREALDLHLRKQCAPEPEIRWLDADTGEERAATPRGWTYNVSFTSPYASMTAAGVGSLAILRDLRSLDGELDESQSAAIAEALRNGAAWLGEYFSASRSHWTSNAPKTFEDPTRFYYYYLYSLEKAGSTAPAELFKDVRWYRDGAAALCADQFPDGLWWNGKEWGSQGVATAFAVLFLKRASAVIHTDLAALAKTGQPAAALTGSEK